MTRRDLRWKLAGIPVFAMAGGLGWLANVGAEQLGSGVCTLLGVIAFALYLTGAVLVIQGERVASAWRRTRPEAPRILVKTRAGTGRNTSGHPRR